MTSWNSLSQNARPQWTVTVDGLILWQAYPVLTPAQGVGFGQGGFGVDGFGARAADLSGLSRPVWASETIK